MRDQLIKERFKPLFYPVLSHTLVKRCLESIPHLRKILPAYHRTHPFDRQYGTDTSGVVPVQMITSDKALLSKINPYGASQPSIIRHAITALGKTEEYNFVDLGCGKGRAIIVASEFPFRSISGIELSSDLAKIARRNIAIVERCFPMRPPVAAIEGNALTSPFPESKLVLFFCHSFGEELLLQLIKKLETSLSFGNGPVFFIYYNPVHGNVLDASPVFSRWYADTLQYDESELGFGPDTEDSVVIWQSIGGAAATPHPYAERSIIITKPLWKAGLTGGWAGARAASADAARRSRVKEETK
jgi:SAM-dependent methyltransferase